MRNDAIVIPEHPLQRQPWGWERVATILLAGSLLAGGSGCIGITYAVYANDASSKIEQARTLGALEYAPYEFHSAEEYLKKAAEEASGADYSDAIDFADKAEIFADQAIALSRDAHRGAGR